MAPRRRSVPEEIIGNDYEGWQGEKWLDIRRMICWDRYCKLVLTSACQSFDGLNRITSTATPAIPDFSSQHPGSAYLNIWLANQAHARGLSIGLKNDDEQRQIYCHISIGRSLKTAWRMIGASK
jgi:hypothetical protein